MVHSTVQTFSNKVEHLSDRIVRVKEVVQLLGISRSTIYDKLNTSSKRHDPSFPKPVKLGGAAIGWRLSMILAWIESLNTTN